MREMFFRDVPIGGEFVLAPYTGGSRRYVKVSPHGYRYLEEEEERWHPWRDPEREVACFDRHPADAELYESFRLRLGEAIHQLWIPPKLADAMQEALSYLQRLKLWNDFGFDDYDNARRELFELRAARRRGEFG